MNLIIHDLSKEQWEALAFPLKEETKIIDNSGKIKKCMGCFGCWLKTPGRCVIPDEYQRIGKTTTATALAGILSKQKKTLLIDADPQGNCTSTYEAVIEDQATLYDVMVDSDKLPLEEAIQHMPVDFDHIKHVDFPVSIDISIDHKCIGRKLLSFAIEQLQYIAGRNDTAFGFSVSADQFQSSTGCTDIFDRGCCLCSRLNSGNIVTADRIRFGGRHRAYRCSSLPYNG